jgi:hypothetical protein
MVDTRIENPAADPFVSRLLRAVADELEQSRGVSVSVERHASEGAKGPVVDAIVAGIGTNLSWEVLKLAARRLRDADDYRPDAQVRFGMCLVTIEQLEGDEPSADPR